MTSTAQRFWLNIALLLSLLAIVSGGYWAWKSLEADKTVKYLLPMKVSELTNILLERYLDTTKPERIEFVRQGDKWWMNTPYKVEANPVKLRQLITLANEPIIARYSTQGLDLAAFDLAPIKTQISLNQYVIGFGNTNPVTTQRYVLVNNELVLVSEVVAGLLAGSALDLVARTLIPNESEVIEVIMPDGRHITDVELRSQWQAASALSIEQALNSRADLPLVRIKLKAGGELSFQVEQTTKELKLTQIALGLTYILPLNWHSTLLPAGSGL
ncbi:MAG: hypothetical protein WAQ53_09565 [Thiofilum sp.]|uniref:hypothetical protein n=1 Tax=Thiofilum sp. TaxID=2212733 RepID=UPI0025ED856D|nr:hypothetical protein [Thiofilum sp.]MBK8453105.1 hypothetical protein [Thiofilum sp.]